MEHFARAWLVIDLTRMIELEACLARNYQLIHSDTCNCASAHLKRALAVFSEDFSDGAVFKGVRFVNPFAAGFVLESWA